MYNKVEVTMLFQSSKPEIIKPFFNKLRAIALAWFPNFPVTKYTFYKNPLEISLKFQF